MKTAGLETVCSLPSPGQEACVKLLPDSCPACACTGGPRQPRWSLPWSCWRPSTCLQQSSCTRRQQRHGRMRRSRGGILEFWAPATCMPPCAYAHMLCQLLANMTRQLVCSPALSSVKKGKKGRMLTATQGCCSCSGFRVGHGRGFTLVRVHILHNNMNRLCAARVHEPAHHGWSDRVPQAGNAIHRSPTQIPVKRE